MGEHVGRTVDSITEHECNAAVALLRRRASASRPFSSGSLRRSLPSTTGRSKAYRTACLALPALV
jgi:hypothetical protein